MTTPKPTQNQVSRQHEDKDRTLRYQSPGLDDACVDKLHDLIANKWVAHVILQGTRVLLGLLQNRLHDRVGHDLLYVINLRDCFSQHRNKEPKIEMMPVR